jgi:hypothetical protein
MTPTTRGHLSATELISRVLDCDHRTRRARSLVLTMSFGAALVLVAASAPLTGAFGVSGAAGALAAVGLAIRRGLQSRHTSKENKPRSPGKKTQAGPTAGGHDWGGRNASHP